MDSCNNNDTTADHTVGTEFTRLSKLDLLEW